MTISVDPAGMKLTAYDDEKVRRISEDYKGVKLVADHTRKEWRRRWKNALIVDVEDFRGSVEILTHDGTILGSFSGSDEYGGQVHNVWKITTRLQKKGYPETVWQLWTSYNLIES